MRKTVILLSIFALVAGGCKQQTEKKQAEVVKKVEEPAIVKPLSAREQQHLNTKLKEALGANASIDLVKALIKRGADVNTSGEKYRPISLAIRRGDFDYLKFLVEEKKADIRVPGGGYGSILSLAVREQKPDMVLYLLEHGADVNSSIFDENNRPPIIFAAGTGNKQIVRILLSKGADINQSEHSAWCHAKVVSEEWANFVKELGADTTVNCAIPEWYKEQMRNSWKDYDNDYFGENGEEYDEGYYSDDNEKLSHNEIYSDKDDTPAIKMLREFYTQYITACDKISFNHDAFVSVKEKFVTEELRQKIDNASLDYDPFLYAQDCDRAWLESLEIAFAGQDNAYTVCYYLSPHHTQQCVTLYLVEKDGYYLINDLDEFR